jgi:hypothetical protein
MTGYELTLEDFAWLVGVASRHHRKQIASCLSLTAHVRRGEVFFRDSNGVAIPFVEIHQKSQEDVQIQRSLYNLFMDYAHFG